MKTRILKFFFVSTALALFLTAVAKLYSATGTAKILSISDPLFHLNNGTLMSGLGLLEAAVAVYLLLGRDQLMRAAVLLWLSSNFIMYRLAIDLLGVKMCPCLGTLASNLPLSKAQVENSLAAFVLYWFLGSAFILWSEWLKQQEPSPPLVAKSEAASLFGKE